MKYCIRQIKTTYFFEVFECCMQYAICNMQYAIFKPFDLLPLFNRVKKECDYLAT
jgi:hypothetical protein